MQVAINLGVSKDTKGDGEVDHMVIRKVIGETIIVDREVLGTIVGQFIRTGQIMKINFIRNYY